MGAREDSRLVAALGGPVPADPKTAARALREQTAALNEDAKRAERKASLIPSLLAAVAEVEHDIALRTSPGLRRLQDRGEALRLRKHRARASADRVVVNLAHWQHVISSGTSSQPRSTGPEEEPTIVEEMPTMVRMQEMLDRFRDVRFGTDRIGQDG